MARLYVLHLMEDELDLLIGMIEHRIRQWDNNKRNREKRGKFTVEWHWRQNYIELLAQLKQLKGET